MLQIGDFFTFRLQPQLPAGRVDVVAFLAPQRGGDIVRPENCEKIFLPVARWSRPLEAGHGIIGNKIHLGRQSPRVARKHVRLLVRIVYVCDENVLKRDPLLPACRVVVAGLEQCCDIVFAIHRHDLIAHLIGGGVQGNREADLQRLVRELADLRRQTTGRDGDMSCTNGKSPWCVYDSNRAHDVRKIRQRLAHSHEDDVVDFFSAFLFDRDELIDNLVRQKIARKSFEAARAKFAAVSATDLSRNTNRPPIRSLAVKCRRCRNQDRLDQIFVAQPEQELLRRIFRIPARGSFPTDRTKIPALTAREALAVNPSSPQTS